MKNRISSLSKQTKSDFITYAIVVIAFIVLQPLKSLGVLSNSFSGQLVPICAYIVMAVSLNFTVGILGELSLGHAGFMSVGAFTGVVVASAVDSAPNVLKLILAMLVGGIIAGIAGFLIGIPVLRLRGDYLAIVTLAFGQIIKNIIDCLYVGIDGSGLHFSMTSADALNMDKGRVVINGPMGAVGVSKIATFAAGFILVMITLIVVLNIKRSRTGRAVMALRDNRIAAESVGINVTRYKMTAFVISAFLAGCAGALYAMNYSTIVAKKFDYNTSILVLVFVVLGGMGNIRGTVIATTILYMLPEILRGFEDYRMLIYAVVLIAVMLFTNGDGAKARTEKITSVISGIFKKKTENSGKEEVAK